MNQTYLSNTFWNLQRFHTVFDSNKPTFSLNNLWLKLRNIANQKEYASGTTDANGMYKVGDIEEGRYILGVTATQGDFNFDYVMLLKDGAMAKLSVALAPGTPAANGDSSKKNFFGTTVGFLTMVAVAGAIFFAVFIKGEAEASPIR